MTVRHPIHTYLDPGLRRDDVSELASGLFLNNVTPAKAGVQRRKKQDCALNPSEAG
jgi:hypothetical protein